MPLDYYEFIAVDQTATTEEIKRACFRKRKQLAIDKDDKGQEYLNEVAQTLQDPQARAEYDALSRHGAEIERLTDDAGAAMEDERWADAARLLKRVLVLMPDQAFATNRLGICFLRLNQFKEAYALYKKLTTQHPDVAVYWANFGHMLYQAAEITPPAEDAAAAIAQCPHCRNRQRYFAKEGIVDVSCASCHDTFRLNTNHTREQLLQQSRVRYQKAIELESYNASYYLDMAGTYELAGDYTRAIEWAERAVGADGKADIQDFEALFYISRLYGLRGLWGKIRATAARLLEVLPADPEAREYAAHRFARFALDLWELDVYDAASAFAEAALVFMPDDKTTRELAAITSRLARAHEEFSRMNSDRNLNDAIRRAAIFFLGIASDQKVDDPDGLLQDICEHLDSFSHQSNAASLNWLRRNYPATYECGSEFFNDLDDFLRQQATPPRNTYPPATSSSGGCCLMPVLLALLAAGGSAACAIPHLLR